MLTSSMAGRPALCRAKQRPSTSSFTTPLAFRAAIVSSSHLRTSAAAFDLNADIVHGWQACSLQGQTTAEHVILHNPAGFSCGDRVIQPLAHLGRGFGRCLSHTGIIIQVGKKILEDHTPPALELLLRRRGTTEVVG